jgi:hypothetical protein
MDNLTTVISASKYQKLLKNPESIQTLYVKGYVQLQDDTKTLPNFPTTFEDSVQINPELEQLHGTFLEDVIISGNHKLQELGRHIIFKEYIECIDSNIQKIDCTFEAYCRFENLPKLSEITEHTIFQKDVYIDGAPLLETFNNPVGYNLTFKNCPKLKTLGSKCEASHALHLEKCAIGEINFQVEEFTINNCPNITFGPKFKCTHHLLLNNQDIQTLTKCINNFEKFGRIPQRTILNHIPIFTLVKALENISELTIIDWENHPKMKDAIQCRTQIWEQQKRLTDRLENLHISPNQD